ncbi:hypothetical protein TOPH_04377 [Tolypocladium ophioglossoides CBS 100239]|uniref:Uncharacterized protein n=1 Tax=Tolypocladium ophioglossoides (strain CBS 100239) TaxID=1163406 RepID=A0A0L0NBE0_TOLOC|nr:hypothetical protein TOPH_04377 [Tolypocladium ophioglossoides CBS 100239]
MCQVKLSVCKVCGRVFAAQMDHCSAAAEVVKGRDPSPFNIHSSFHWSPLKGCSGLEIQPTANLGSCGPAHQDVEWDRSPWDRPHWDRPRREPTLLAQLAQSGGRRGPWQDRLAAPAEIYRQQPQGTSNVSVSPPSNASSPSLVHSFVPSPVFGQPRNRPELMFRPTVNDPVSTPSSRPLSPVTVTVNPPPSPSSPD